MNVVYDASMLNIKTDHPLKKEVLEEVQTRLAQMRDLTLEVEEVLRSVSNGKVLLTREETAKILRCDAKRIPHKIPHLRCGRSILYEQSDVFEFINSSKRH